MGVGEGENPALIITIASFTVGVKILWNLSHLIGKKTDLSQWSGKEKTELCKYHRWLRKKRHRRACIYTHKGPVLFAAVAFGTNPTGLPPNLDFVPSSYFILLLILNLEYHICSQFSLLNSILNMKVRNSQSSMIVAFLDKSFTCLLCSMDCWNFFCYFVPNAGWLETTDSLSRWRHCLSCCRCWVYLWLIIPASRQRRSMGTLCVCCFFGFVITR